jgi:hypothetical protein
MDDFLPSPDLNIVQVQSIFEKVDLESDLEWKKSASKYGTYGKFGMPPLFVGQGGSSCVERTCKIVNTAKTRPFVELGNQCSIL